MRTLLPGLCGVGLCLALLLLGPASRAAETTSRTWLDGCVVDYRDTHQIDVNGGGRSGRVVATIRAELWQEGAYARLLLYPCALGERVVPMPGFEGVPGGNRMTADELGRLASGDSELRIVVRPRTGAEVSGDASVSQRGHLPVKRLLPDGTLELSGVEAFERVLELELRTERLAPGDWIAEVYAGGHMRLVVELRWADAAGEILAVREGERSW